MLELKWDGKDEALEAAEETKTHLLEFDKNFSFGEKNSGNMVVQGDNLKVLKSLLPFYRGQVKCIYIDPPYNTNAAIENYSDNFPHSDWLNMMYPRLELLREFLSEDGAIFISIDDTEQAYLKVICDEIFTRKNFVASLVWEKKKKGSFLSKVVTNVKEYILVYCKSGLFGGLIGEINRSTETYPCINPVNSRGIRVIPKGIPSNFREKNYQIEANTRISAGNMDLIYLDKAVIDDGILQNDVRIESNWRYQQSMIDEFAEQNSIYLTRDNYVRRIVKETRIKMLKDLLLRVGSDGESEKIFTYDENLNNGGWGTNEDANDELHKIFGKQYAFDFSKPSRLIGKLIQTISDKDSIILDSFAGSGTTAHAVLKLNESDGGNRKFILIEDKDYCKTITAERVRRVGGSFDFYQLGAEITDSEGKINSSVTFEQLANFVWFSATKTPYLEQKNSPLLGVHDGTAIYLLYNGILKDKSVKGGNVLTKKILSALPKYDGEKMIYGSACRIEEKFLEENKITFRQIPKELNL